MRDVIRVKHYRQRTDRSYCGWVERFFCFDLFARCSLSLWACPSMSHLPSYSIYAMRHAREMRDEEVGAFLTHLARRQNVARGFEIRGNTDRDRQRYTANY